MKKRPQLKNNWFDCLINYDPKPTKKQRVIKKLKKKKKRKNISLFKACTTKNCYKPICDEKEPRKPTKRLTKSLEGYISKDARNIFILKSNWKTS